MSFASGGIWGARRPTVGWVGLTAFVLLAACGGERRESPNAATEGAAVTDSAPTPSSDTVTAAPSKDTAAKQPAQPPAAPSKPAPAAPTKPAPASPTKPPKPAPAAPAADTAAPKQDTAAATGSDTTTGGTQTAEAPLRDQYHQAPRDTVSQEVYDGWKQFNLNCARCHGEDVLGTTIAPHLILSLKPDGPINTPELFTQVVCAGRPEKGMPSWCALGMDPAKIGQIYAYVKGRSEGKIHPGRPAVKPEG